MNRLLAAGKGLYGTLPPFGRGAAASAYGYFLRWWRYGPGLEDRVEAARERETWSSTDWDRWAEARLAHVLERAATRVPYYRSLWRQRRADGDERSWTRLENWPILDKQQLRRQPSAFLADDVDRRTLFESRTSGTTGIPLTLWHSQQTARAWYGLNELRSRRWYGLDVRTPWAILGGQAVIPLEQRRPPFWTWNAGLRQLYMSSMHISPSTAADYADAMVRHGVRYLYGYSSTMYLLARMIRERGVVAPRMVVAISNAEPLLPHQRELIGETFGCPVRETYGMSEMVAGASECEAGRLHVWPEAGMLEVLAPDGRRLGPGVGGEFVCTGLLNDDMPLVRYRVGDHGSVAPDAPPCACGRTLPSIADIDGRVTDNLTTPDGRRFFAVNAVFEGLPIHERQVIQQALDHIEVHVVPDEGFGPEDERLIIERLRQRVGTVRIDIRRVERIPRGSNGKFKNVVNLVANDR